MTDIVSNADRTKKLLADAAKARKFPSNTCGASRHAEMIAEALIHGQRYEMLTEEPEYCGESILAAVVALWRSRTTSIERAAEIERLRAALNSCVTIKNFGSRSDEWLSGFQAGVDAKNASIKMALSNGQEETQAKEG